MSPHLACRNVFALREDVDVHICHGDAQRVRVDSSDQKIQHQLLFTSKHVLNLSNERGYRRVHVTEQPGT